MRGDINVEQLPKHHLDVFKFQTWLRVSCNFKIFTILHLESFGERIDLISSKKEVEVLKSNKGLTLEPWLSQRRH